MEAEWGCEALRQIRDSNSSSSSHSISRGASVFMQHIFWRFQFLATCPTLISILNQGLSYQSSIIGCWFVLHRKDRSATGTCHYGCHLSSLSWVRVNLVSIVCHKLPRKLNINNQFPSLPPNGEKHFELRKDSWAGWHLMWYTSTIY